MIIHGIDVNKCNKCRTCVRECPVNLFRLNTEKRVEFSDPHQWCMGCGHCVCVCPNEAILYSAKSELRKTEKQADIALDRLQEFLSGKRSCRNYKQKEIPDAIIQTFLDTARFSPSSHNYQPCEYVVIKEKKMMQFLADETIKSYKRLTVVMKFSRLLKPFIPQKFYKILSDKSFILSMEDMVAKYDKGKDVVFFDAPVIILVHVPDLGPLSYVDSSIALTYGMLALHDCGIGSCWIGLAMLSLPKNKKVFNTLHISNDRKITGIISMGYPVNTYHSIPERNEVKAAWIV